MYASVNQVSIASDDGLSPIRRQNIIRTNTVLFSIGPLGNNFCEIQNLSFTKMHLKTTSVKWCPFCPGGDELNRWLFCYQRKPPWIKMFRMTLSSWPNRWKEPEFDMDAHNQLKCPETKMAAITSNFGTVTQILVWGNKGISAPKNTLRIRNLLNHSINTTKPLI